ncbi:MAG: hypothetical protein LC737_11450 [Chloroflexi bacterium]|nr:hypothetical protein [Chloroflexota bacterium]
MVKAPALKSGDCVAIQQRTGLVTFHGPNLHQLGSSAETRERLIRALTSAEPIRVQRLTSNVRSAQSQDATPDIERGTWDVGQPILTFHGGSATGTLIGGSLRALVGLLGTRFAFEPRGTLLFLEEAQQRFSRFDRDLTTLRLADVTTRVNGIVVGECAGASAHRDIICVAPLLLPR